MLAPFGITVVAFGLVCLRDCRVKLTWEDLDKAAEYVELGTV